MMTVFLIVIFYSCIYFCKKHKRVRDKLTQAEIAVFVRGDPGSIDHNQPIQDQLCLLPYNNSIEFPRQEP